MSTVFKYTGIAAVITVISLSLFSFGGNPAKEKNASHFPYKQAGLTNEQAAAHLLSRFSYGPTPGQVKEVAAMGVENWFRQQLKADFKDDSLHQLLKGYDLLTLSNEQIVQTVPRGGQAYRMAVKDGFIHKDSLQPGRREYRDKVAEYMQQKGLRPQQELTRQFTNQKIMRAAYSQNQLQEIMSDFWFNHFNVSFTKDNCAQYIPSYERDVIRPNALGKFEDLLKGTAQSPAMLVYLDNFSSTGTPVKMEAANVNPNKKGRIAIKSGIKPAQAKKKNGLNENYAREVMELHTLGVDGGYTQQDVTQAARVLTGWTVFPYNKFYGESPISKQYEQAGEAKMAEKGFVRKGDFLFVPTRHDNGEKIVLGKKFPAGGGYEEGEELLHLLATNPSTATFISRKLAVRFVSDNPPQSLINKMAATFLDKRGDITQVLITMVSAPEFWTKDALREKTKSPFELTISSVRALRASVNQPAQLYTWINRMGQKMYYYQAPTGFPDKGEYWINTGSLLSRMNFGLALAAQRIPGVQFNLLALNNNHEPESAEAALETYGRLFLPERNLDATITRLTPLLNDPQLQQKVESAASKTSMAQKAAMDSMEEDADGRTALAKMKVKPVSETNKYMLPQVVGIIIGSPEFQRK